MIGEYTEKGRQRMSVLYKVESKLHLHIITKVELDASGRPTGDTKNTGLVVHTENLAYEVAAQLNMAHDDGVQSGRRDASLELA
jgi:hypothetical protein